MTKKETRERLESGIMEFVNNGGRIKKVGKSVNRGYKHSGITDEQMRALPKNIRTLMSNIKWKKR